MKIRLWAVALLWAGVAAAQSPDTAGAPPAGGPGFHRESAARRLEHLAVLLDLTDEQKPQVAAVLEEEHAKMEAAHDQAVASGQKPSFEQMKTEHEQLKQETLTKLTSVLTAAQLRKFQVLMEERGPPGGPHERSGR